MLTISDILYDSAQNNPAREAIIDNDKRVTYLSLLAMSKNLAQDLQHQGLCVGEHVAILLPRSLEYVVSYFAILFCGGVVVPIGADLKPREIYTDLHYCDVSLLITNDHQSDKVAQVLEKEGSLPLLKQTTLLQHPSNTPSSQLESLLHVNYHTLKTDEVNALKIVERQQNDVAILLHTSGTTSDPKRVMLSHANILANVRSNIASLNLTIEDNVLIALPMHFGYCNTAQMLTHLYLGGKIVLAPNRFTSSVFYGLVEQEHITTFTGVPTMLLMLEKQKPSKNYDISSLRYICFGGGPMPNNSLRQLLESFPSVGFVHTYGQTEASPRITALLPEDSIRKLGSIGKPIPQVQLALLNEDENPVGVGQVGEIVVNGPNIMMGYYKKVEQTQRVLRSVGLFTGDLAWADEEGYLYLVGRRKNIIICGGINIYPEEIEECLLGHPGVSEVVIVGEIHEMLGEMPIALVVPYSEVDVTEDDLIRYCAGKLANYKLPRRVEFRNELAKTYNAKIQRFGQD